MYIVNLRLNLHYTIAFDESLPQNRHPKKIGDKRVFDQAPAWNRGVPHRANMSDTRDRLVPRKIDGMVTGDECNVSS